MNSTNVACGTLSVSWLVRIICWLIRNFSLELDGQIQRNTQRLMIHLIYVDMQYAIAMTSFLVAILSRCRSHAQS